MKADEMVDVLAALAALWPQADVERRYAAGMAMMCADLPAALVTSALRELAADGREFPPPPGLVRKTVEAKALDADVLAVWRGLDSLPSDGQEREL